MSKINIFKINVILLLLSVLFPPYVIRIEELLIERRWGFLFSIPQGHERHLPMEVDIPTLVVEFILIGTFGGLLYLFKRK